jgi:hypothetical protein
MLANTPGAILQPQPPPWENEVKRIGSEGFMHHSNKVASLSPIELKKMAPEGAIRPEREAP